MKKIAMMTIKELEEERKKYNKKDHEFTLYIIDKSLEDKQREDGN